jgi:hypothetical membrane protein
MVDRDVRGRALAIGRWSGFAAAIVGVGTVLLATLLAPWFSWNGDALSDLGDPARATAPSFNAGVFLAGFLGFVFVVRLWIEVEGSNWVRRLALVVLGTSFASLGLVGVFPVGSDLHFPVAVGYFVALTGGLWLYGSADALEGATKRGVATIWLGIASVSGWGVVAAIPSTSGIAIPEAVSTIALAGWAVSTTLRLGRKTGE